MTPNLKLLYYLKRKKKNISGLVPVYLRITLDYNRCEISVNRKVDPELWDSKSGTVKGNSEEIKTLNHYLHQFKSNVLNQFNILLSTDDEFSIEDLKCKVTGKGNKKYYLIEIFDLHNTQMKKRIGKDYAYGTYKGYLVTFNKLKKYISKYFNSKDIRVDKLNYQFISNFELFLKTKENVCHNTAFNQIKNLKKVINWALANEWILKNPFANFKCSYKDPNRDFLTEDELNKLISQKLSNQKLEKVRDIFVFSCYTGLAYSDVKELNSDHIYKDINGNKWIKIFRRKTGERSSIPLLPMAEKVINKYKNYPGINVENNLLPIMSNQKMNEYLKQVAEKCKVKKKITFHQARHTFATTVTLKNGVPLETVSAMLGHRSIKTTQIYAKITDLKILIDVKRLRTTFNNEENKVAL